LGLLAVLGLLGLLAVLRLLVVSLRVRLGISLLGILIALLRVTLGRAVLGLLLLLGCGLRVIVRIVLGPLLGLLGAKSGDRQEEENQGNSES
jgi:hypothetical protein